MTMEKRAPLASLDDFSSISYYSPSTVKKSPGFTSPLLKRGKLKQDVLPENNDNFENLAKYNASRKLRPLVKVPEDRLVLFNGLYFACNSCY